MGRIVVFESVTLDGVMQSPSAPEEDARDGFAHGGWAAPYADEITMGLASEGSGETDGLLLGRRTYEQFYGYWPQQEGNEIADILTRTRKYVASTTLPEPLPWANSTLLKGDATAEVARLRERPGESIVVLGSGTLVRSLLRERLVDTFTLLIHPLVLGSGQRLFEGGDPKTTLRLDSIRTNTTGVVIATYQADNEG